MCIRYLLTVLLIFSSLGILAASFAQGNRTLDNSMQKVVVLEGRRSRLMNGDPLLYEISKEKAQYKFNENEVLPYLLQTGWKIVSLNINEKSRPDRPYGYAVLERKKSPDK